MKIVKQFSSFSCYFLPLLSTLFSNTFIMHSFSKLRDIHTKQSDTNEQILAWKSFTCDNLEIYDVEMLKL
jgi:hypothetical protein